MVLIIEKRLDKRIMTQRINGKTVAAHLLIWRLPKSEEQLRFHICIVKQKIYLGKI